MKRLCLTATLFGLLILASRSAGASSLTLSFSGEFALTSTLGGTALGGDNAFSYTATFDTTTGISIATGVEIFPTVATFNIPGVGIFTSAAGDDLYVGLADPTSNTAKDYEAVLTNLAVTADFGAAYSTATPGFTAADPVPFNPLRFRCRRRQVAVHNHPRGRGGRSCGHRIRVGRFNRNTNAHGRIGARACHLNLVGNQPGSSRPSLLVPLKKLLDVSL